MAAGHVLRLALTLLGWLLLGAVLGAHADGEPRNEVSAAVEARRLSALYASAQCAATGAEPASCCGAGADAEGCRQDLSLLQAAAVAHHRAGAAVPPTDAKPAAVQVAPSAAGARSKPPKPASASAAAVSASAAAAPAEEERANSAAAIVGPAEAAAGVLTAGDAAAFTAVAAQAATTEAAVTEDKAVAEAAGDDAEKTKADGTRPAQADPEALQADADASAVGAAAAAVGRVLGRVLGPQVAVKDDGRSDLREVNQEPQLGPQTAAEKRPRWRQASRAEPAVAPLEALSPALRSLGELLGRLPSLTPRGHQAPASLQQRSAAASGAALAAESTAGAATAAGEGDIVQGLVFTLICLIIVIGIYLLVFNEYRPGETAVPLGFDRTAAGRSSVWRWGDGAAGGMLSGLASSRLASAKSLASGRETLQAASVTQISRFGGMPGTPPSTLPTPQERISSIVGGSREDDWYTELPEIYPQLVIPAAHTRLAVPLAVLTQPSFVLDILSRGGLRLLNAHLEEGKERLVQISQEDGGLLASVSSELVVCGGDGQRFGVLCRERVAPQLGLADCPQLVLRDRVRRPICVLVVTRRDANGYDFKLHSVSAGRLVERATAVRRPPQPPPFGRLPGEHYELVVNPQVDAVLVLAILLGAVVFALPPPSGHIQPPMSGRASTALPS